MEFGDVMAGLLGGVGAGLSQIGKDQREQELLQQKEQAQRDRDAAVEKAKVESWKMEQQFKEDAATKERNRVRDSYAQPVLAQKDAATGLLADRSGANDPESRSGDDIGEDVQKKSRAPTISEMSDRALAAGDVPNATSIRKIDDKDQSLAVTMAKNANDAANKIAELNLKIEKATGGNGEIKPADAMKAAMDIRLQDSGLRTQNSNLSAEVFKLQQSLRGKDTMLLDESQKSEITTDIKTRQATIQANEDALKASRELQNKLLALVPGVAKILNPGSSQKSSGSGKLMMPMDALAKRNSRTVTTDDSNYFEYDQ